MDRRANRIKLEDCQHRKLYKLIARNILIGVFNKDDQDFTGIRTKFGNRFLDSENHWDAPSYATCCPMEIIGELPAEIDVEPYLGYICKDCRTPIESFLLPDDQQVEKVLENGEVWKSSRVGWRHLTYIYCIANDIHPITIDNKALFKYLEEQEALLPTWAKESEASQLADIQDRTEQRKRERDGK